DGSTDWVRNLAVDPAVAFEVAGSRVGRTAMVVPDLPADALVRRALASKYGAGGGEPLGPWAATALAVRVTT
ncbi:MAG: hypothetical protein ACKOZL_10105, partial [Actinomycetes bacterium]